MKKYIEKFQSLEKGQKIKLILVIVLVIVILYMLNGLFGGGNSNTATMKNQASSQPAHIQLNATVTEKRVLPKPEIIVNDLSDKQMAYLKAVNELQMLQLKQQIAQSKQQIAQAELEAAQSNQKLKSITEPPPPPVFNTITQQQGSTMAAPVAPDDYQLQYIANEGGKWQVIISNNGKLINATMGTTLPDGSQITHISGSTVTLLSNGQSKILTIAPSY